MTQEFRERRRSPRIAVAGRQEFRLGRRIRVKVVDISATGALLAAEEALPVGTKGRLQVLLGGDRFEGQVEIRREQPGPSAREHLLGAIVVPSQARHQEALDQFLRRAGS